MLIVDRRNSNKAKSRTNRYRFLQRIRFQIRDAIDYAIEKNHFDKLSSSNRIKVPIRNIEEEHFKYDYNTGIYHTIYSGNKKFVEGDKIPKNENEEDEGKGSAGLGPDGKDSFFVTIDKNEFADYFFDNLELPDFIKKSLKNTIVTSYKRKGVVNSGPAARLNIIRTYKKGIGRRLASKSGIKEKIDELEEKLKNTDPSNLEYISDLKYKIDFFNRKLKKIPLFVENDLKYNNIIAEHEPSTSAVMFCIMDISGSMGRIEKTIAKKFFFLLYLFLKKQYDNIDLVFIIHTVDAREVTEDEFFNTTDTGGTMVSPALKLTEKIIKERYPSDDWNIYISQISDGDSYDDIDAEESSKIVSESLLNKAQYFAYIEVMREYETLLMESYKNIGPHKNFVMKSINKEKEIWNVFESLFSKDKEVVDD